MQEANIILTDNKTVVLMFSRSGSTVRLKKIDDEKYEVIGNAVALEKS